MAGASSGFPMVDVHYLGLFSPNPLLYIHGEMKKLRDVDLKAMSWPEFRSLLSTMTECTLDRLYYCPAKEKLAKGLNALQSECDYNDFIECAYGV
ncbi:hypothetical protein L2E82_51463 [Cichorium intybus]|nr:hypothetical protein L2E82_51463 [Cichorium intybus]